MLYLFLGNDALEKERAIADVKASCLKTKDDLELDYNVIDGAHCPPEEFKKSLLALPALAPQRMLLVRRAHKLSLDNRKILAAFLESQPDHLVIILDSEQRQLNKKIFADILRKARTEVFQQGAPLDIFELKQVLNNRQPTEALQFVTELMDEGHMPINIIGVLVWAWGSISYRMPSETFQQGLSALKQADFNIKRSRLAPRQAVEVAVVHLTQLIG